jgi:hypothetical protein
VVHILQDYVPVVAIADMNLELGASYQHVYISIINMRDPQRRDIEIPDLVECAISTY